MEKAPVQGQQTVMLDQLPPQQLLQVKQNLEEEITMLQQSINQFRTALNKYDQSKLILKSLENAPQNNQILLPITSSLYIPGTILGEQKVTIDYGTGYYVQRNLNQASEYCTRKINLIKESVEKISNILSQKATFLDKVNLEIQKQVIQMQKEQQAAGKK